MEKSHKLSHSERFGSLTKIPLVELAGQNRVLIENHGGVLAYGLEEITIKVAYGSLKITGNQLRLMELCREQLVITGQIASVHLIGG